MMQLLLLDLVQNDADLGLQFLDPDPALDFQFQHTGLQVSKLLVFTPVPAWGALHWRVAIWGCSCPCSSKGQKICPSSSPGPVPIWGLTFIYVNFLAKSRMSLAF